MGAVPLEMLLRRRMGGIGRQGYLFVFHPCKQVGLFSGFGKVPVGDENGIVVPKGPEAVVEEPVGVFGQGNAVVQVVVAAVGELVDVAGGDDGACGKGGRCS